MGVKRSPFPFTLYIPFMPKQPRASCHPTAVFAYRYNVKAPIQELRHSSERKPPFITSGKRFRP